MDAARLAKRLSHYESGVITAPEWANALLYDLVSGPELDTTSLSFLDSLPHDVGQEFRRLMARIAEADFRWTPFFLTSSTAPRDPTEYSDRLRRVSTLLGQGRANGEVKRPAEPVSQEVVAAGKSSATGAESD